LLKGELQTEAFVAAFDFVLFAVEDDAEAVQRVIGGELVSHRHDGIEDLVLGK
jgi:hypothetical protein